MASEALRSTVPATEEALVGVEPVRRIVLMEDHDQAYHAWKEAGLKDRMVVHVDPHIDFAWLPEKDPEELLKVESLRELEEQSSEAALWNLTSRTRKELIGIGNYLNPALREGIIRGICWVVPDGFFETREQRKELHEIVADLGKSPPRTLEKIAWTSESLTAEIYGKPVVVCTLSGLPEFDESILLDLDTDFMVISSISRCYPYADFLETKPWIWPEELLARLGRPGLRTDFVTIAYSVEGGYTPLAYKYLGDELATLLKDPVSGNHREIMALRRQAALLQEEQRFKAAGQQYERVLDSHSDDPSTHYRLAQIYFELGHANQGQDHFRQAVALDSSYRTQYNNLGPVYFNLGRFAESEGEYRKALILDPENGDVHRGLGDLSSQRQNWDQAILHYRKAVELKPDQAEIHFDLGEAYARLSHWSEAEGEFQQALSSRDYEGLAHCRLGLIYRKGQRWEAALEAYKAARRSGVRNLAVHLNLARLYLRKRKFYQASRYGGKVIRALPFFLWLTVRRLVTRTLRLLSGRRRDAWVG